MQSVTADHSEDTDWSDNDPSVFVTNNVARLQGEYQICNGYGITKATQVLRVRYATSQASFHLLHEVLLLQI
jgi:hypothetical protein